MKKIRKLVDLKESEAHENSIARKHTPAGEAQEPSGATIDRRGRDRRGSERRKEGLPVAVERRNIERRVKVNRRRQIDPTTCERDYSDHEVEFMNALEQYKRTSGRMFPTCSEILEVLRGLGYAKLPQPAPAEPLATTPTEVAPTDAAQPAAAL